MSLALKLAFYLHDQESYILRDNLNKSFRLLSLGLHDQIEYDLHIYDVTGRKCKLIGADIVSSFFIQISHFFTQFRIHKTLQQEHSMKK